MADRLNFIDLVRERCREIISVEYLTNGSPLTMREPYGEVLAPGTDDGIEAVLIQRHDRKKIVLRADGTEIVWDRKNTSFVPTPVDFYEHFQSRVFGVGTIVDVLSLGSRDGKPAVHALGRVYNQDWVWTPDKDWPIGLKMDSHLPDPSYVVGVNSAPAQKGE